MSFSLQQACIDAWRKHKLAVILAPTASAVLLAGIALPAFASPVPTIGMQALTLQKTHTACTTVQCVQQRGDSLSTREIAGIDRLRDQLQQYGFASDATVLEPRLTTVRADIIATKQKLDAETTIAAARVDVKILRTDGRTLRKDVQDSPYGSFTVVEARADHFQNVREGKLDMDIQKAEQSGKNVSQAQISLTDMKNKVADAEQQLSDARKFLNSDQPGQQNAMVDTAQSDLRQAEKDAQSIRADLGLPTAVHVHVKAGVAPQTTGTVTQ